MSPAAHTCAHLSRLRVTVQRSPAEGASHREARRSDQPQSSVPLLLRQDMDTDGSRRSPSSLFWGHVLLVVQGPQVPSKGCGREKLGSSRW